MAKNYEHASFKKLLEKLQEESWQLELLISGFAIFGLFTAFDPIQIARQEARINNQDLVEVILMVAGVSCAILIFNLLLHVILRGLWIGALGLRYVSGDIDYEALNYSPKFTNYLKKKIGSFDRYIANLENYCSVIFAISFLLIFYVIAFTLTMASIALVMIYIMDNDALNDLFKKTVGRALIVFIIVGMLSTFLDFVTQGWLKKKKWISKIYFPIYWVFSFITLSFLYRPLVYNFLDNKFGRRLSFVLVPIYFLILLGTSLKYEKSNYLAIGNNSTKFTASDKNYENLLQGKKGQFINTGAIQSKVISEPYLKVFIPYIERMENRVFKRNKGLKPENDIRGLGFDIDVNNDGISKQKRDSLKHEYMKTLNAIYSVKIDSSFRDSEFILGHSLTNEFGFETYIDISNLTKGKHLAILEREAISDDADTTMVRFATIPFWYYPD